MMKITCNETDCARIKAVEKNGWHATIAGKGEVKQATGKDQANCQ